MGKAASAAAHVTNAGMGKQLYGVGDVDMLHPPAAVEARKHKLKRKIQAPNSFFMDVKCPGCFNM